MKDIIKLLVLTIDKAFETDWKMSEPISSTIWFELIYKEFLDNFYSKICNYITKCRPSKSDVTFIVIQFDMTFYLIKFIDFKQLIKNLFSIDQIRDLTLYWKFYPDKFYKILSLILDKFYIFNLLNHFNGLILLELFDLLFYGYTILADFFHSSTKFKLLCVQDLSKLSNMANKLSTISIRKQLSNANLKIFDLLTGLLTSEINTGNRYCCQSIELLNQCLESINRFIKSNILTLEDEYKFRYLKILEISIRLIDTCSIQTNSLLGFVQSNMCFDIIKSLIKFESIFF